MADTAAERARRYRARQRGGPPRQPQPCGTRAAKQRHRDNPQRWGELADCKVCSPDDGAAARI